MKTLKILILGMVTGLALGLWGGVNIGKGRPVWSNPFEPVHMADRIRQKSGEMLEKSGEAIQRTGKELQDKMN